LVKATYWGERTKEWINQETKQTQVGADIEEYKANQKWTANKQQNYDPVSKLTLHNEGKFDRCSTNFRFAFGGLIFHFHSQGGTPKSS